MNWGYKLMLVFIAFAGMMLYLVYRSFQTNFELVEKTYYKSELAYQEIIDGTKRANQLSSLPEIIQTGDSILIQLPQELAGKVIEGNTWFYCAYDSRKDKKYLIEKSTNRSTMMKNSLTPGHYIAKISWSADNLDYYAEKSITIR